MNINKRETRHTLKRNCTGIESTPTLNKYAILANHYLTIGFGNRLQNCSVEE